MQDIKAVVAYLTATMGYTVALVIGHSRGSIAGMKWASMTPEGRGISGFVNVAARYRMEVSTASATRPLFRFSWNKLTHALL